MKLAEYKIQNTKRGFTLVEMIVAVGIFSIVMLIATSAIFTVIAANNRAQSLKLLMDNIDFALQSMAREIRVGNTYYCYNDNTSSCPSGDTAFSFYAPDQSTTITYSLSGNNEIVQDNDATNVTLPLTASDINISSLKFYVFSGSNTQPRVLITIAGSTGSGSSLSKFNIQTTVSERQTVSGS